MSKDDDNKIQIHLSFKLNEEVFAINVLELKTDKIVPSQTIGSKYNSGFMRGGGG